MTEVSNTFGYCLSGLVFRAVPCCDGTQFALQYPSLNELVKPSVRFSGKCAKKVRSVLCMFTNYSTYLNNSLKTKLVFLEWRICSANNSLITNISQTPK